jgi:hypothetical protein
METRPAGGGADVTRGRILRAALVLVGVVVGLNVLAGRLERLGGAPGGPISSSFATAPEGLAAFADLAARSGHPVRRLRERPGDGALDPSATLVVLDPDKILPADGTALREFVERGGRLVAGGVRSGAWMPRLLDAPPAWRPGGGRSAAPIVALGELRAVRTIRSDGAGSWREAGQALPVLAGREGALLAVARLGGGRVFLLADASPLQNRLLAEADNAALALALAGPRGRPVHFLESVHGYVAATGVRAVPVRWLWALGGLTLAALAWMLARGRRLGPPERAARELPPPRSEYAEALGGLLAKTRKPAAAAPVQAAARGRLAAIAGVDPADRAALRRAADLFGLPPEEAEALLRELRGSDDVLAAGRALARVQGGTLRAGAGGGP